MICPLDSTAANMSRNNKRENRADSTKTFRTNIASINKLVVKTTSNIKKLGKRDLESSTALAERQLPPPDPAAAPAAVLAMLLMEIGGALNMVIAALGLCEYYSVHERFRRLTNDSAATLALLGPLVESLSMLIASLLPVVTNLLTLLGALLNGVLGGLSLPLAGLLL